MLEEVRKDGIHCIGRKTEHKGTETTQLIGGGAQRMEEDGVTGQGSEGMLLKDHRQKESARNTFHFLSLREPFGGSLGKAVNVKSWVYRGKLWCLRL